MEISRSCLPLGDKRSLPYRAWGFFLLSFITLCLAIFSLTSKFGATDIAATSQSSGNSLRIETGLWTIPEPVAEANLAELKPRDLEDLYLSRSRTLHKRVLQDINEEDENEVRCYLRNILPKAPTLQLCPSDRWPTALSGTLGNEPIAIGTKGNWLIGCTVLLAIKDDTYYIAHYWETPGFGPNKQAGFKSARFQQEVLNYINTGLVTTSGGPTIADPALATIEGLKGGADVFILTIGRGGDDDKHPNYPARIRDIRVEISKDTALGSQTRFHETYYVVTDRTPKVYVLFEYDPQPKRVRFLYSNKQVFDLRKIGGRWQ